MTIPAPWSLPPQMRSQIRQALAIDAATLAFLSDNALIDAVVASARANRVRTIRIAL